MKSVLRSSGSQPREPEPQLQFPHRLRHKGVRPPAVGTRRRGTTAHGPITTRTPTIAAGRRADSQTRTCLRTPIDHHSLPRPLRRSRIAIGVRQVSPPARTGVSTEKSQRDD